MVFFITFSQGERLTWVLPPANLKEEPWGLIAADRYRPIK